MTEQRTKDEHLFGPPVEITSSAGTPIEQQRTSDQYAKCQFCGCVLALNYPYTVCSSPECQRGVRRTSNERFDWRRYVHEQLGFLTDDDNRPAEALIRKAAKLLRASDEMPAALTIKIDPLLCQKCGEPVFNIPRMGIWHECPPSR